MSRDRWEKIMETFKKSDSVKEITKALIEFKKKVPAIKKDGDNPFFKSKYATLDLIIETINKPLAESKLSFVQMPSGNGLITVLMHESGEFIESIANLTPKDNTPQGQGSAITYMRRYALSAMLGLATEEDDDGNAASQQSKKPTVTKKIDSKSKIKELLLKLGESPETADDYSFLVEELTSLKLVPENFDSIVSKLQVLVDKKHGK